MVFLVAEAYFKMTTKLLLHFLGTDAAQCTKPIIKLLLRQGSSLPLFVKAQYVMQSFMFPWTPVLIELD